MNDIAILVENLSKKYRIGRAQQRHDTLRDALVDVGSRLGDRFRRTGANGHADDETIWALKDVSFEVKRGEVVGIIGRNGAGKSTLLKILSQITEPTSGRAEIHGRVGSLLEVGTGFHPELTGRENIFLNGAILGMRREEIQRQFDEIVAFAEIEKFLDTPVKRYSSGMYVRLAFAVAAHLEPEILLVDEVLAVGDAAFQKKCLGKMGDVARGGRTVLFVSHNMAAVSALCGRAFMIDAGEIVTSGRAELVTQSYYGLFNKILEQDLRDRHRRTSSDLFRFTDFRVLDQDGQILEVAVSGQDVSFELLFEAQEQAQTALVNMSLAFFNLMGQPLFLCRSDYSGDEFFGLPSRGSVLCRVPKLPLPPGEFRVNLQCEVNGKVLDWIEGAAIVTVGEGDFYGTGRHPEVTRGDFLVDHQWLPGIGIGADNRARTQ